MRARTKDIVWVAVVAVGLAGVGCDASEDGTHTTHTAVDAGPTIWSGSDGSAGRLDSSSGGGADAGSWTGPGDPAGDDRPGEGSADAGPADAGADKCALRETMEPITLYLSADDSNSMASPAIARRQIREGGGIPTRSYLRTYEFLNYYNVVYPLPEAGHVNVVPELRAGDEPGEMTLQIGVQAPAPPEQPKDRVITLVLDTSGSMGGRPMELERAAARAIAASLEEGDIVSMVEWNTTRTVPLEAYRVRGPSDPTLIAAIDRLTAGGGTNLAEGLRYGYEIAAAHYDPRKLNRVVLISDGQANVGVTSEVLIGMHADDAESDGIYLVGVGVGDGVNDTLMDEVTDAGRGAYVYVDSAEEARHLFVDRFDEVMEVSLLEVRLELTLPWYMAVAVFHGEEISTDPREVRPQHLAPGDAMVFHQELAACDVDELSGADTIHARATYLRPDGRVGAADEHEATIDELLARPDVGFARGNAIVAYAEALKQAGDLGGGAEAIAVLEEARTTVRAANPGGTDPALTEIESLLDAYIATLGG